MNLFRILLYVLHVLVYQKHVKHKAGKLDKPTLPKDMKITIIDTHHHPTFQPRLGLQLWPVAGFVHRVSENFNESMKFKKQEQKPSVTALSHLTLPSSSSFQASTLSPPPSHPAWC